MHSEDNRLSMVVFSRGELILLASLTLISFLLSMSIPRQVYADTVIRLNVLVVAGGGGGGGFGGGGGGAGGFIASTTFRMSIPTTTVNVFVAFGGNGNTASPQNSTNGSSTIIYANGGLTVLGGGYGSSGTAPEACNTGGSGGGFDQNAGSGCAGTAGQGNAGGSGAAPFAGSGGGGGASTVGADGGAIGGDGGAGSSSGASGSGTTYAGGGGGGGTTGGNGGTGGGGAGGTGSANGSNGTNGLGGGGGGGGSGANGGNGGKGIVIIDASTTALTGFTLTCGTNGVKSTSGTETLCTYTTSGADTYSVVTAATNAFTPPTQFILFGF